MNARPKTIKLLEENTVGELPDTGPGNDFSDLTPKAKAKKANVNKKLHQTNKLLHSKEYQQNKVTKWKGKNITNHISDKGLLSKIDKELIQLSKKEIKPIKKWAQNLNRHFLNEDL